MIPRGGADRLQMLTTGSVIAVMLALMVTPQKGHAEDNATAPRPGVNDLTFEHVVRPILQTRCFRCHGAKRPKAKLNLSSADGILKGGESGGILEPGKPGESLLFEMIDKGLMPPDEKDRLSKKEIGIVRRWIESGASFGAAAERQLTQHEIIPILLLRCTVCHGAQKQEGSLDLRTVAGMLKGGKSGPAIIPGKPDQSLLITKIKSGAMPPRRRLVEASIKPIEPQEIKRLEQWIAQGVRVSDDALISVPLRDELEIESRKRFWSFETPVRRPAPTVEEVRRVRNPVDRFVLRKLERRGMSLSPEVDAMTLMRRAYFDLIGLPPTHDEVIAYERELLRDPNAAFDNLVNRLLASPRYGERWARFWLDAAGYSDSEGVQHDDTIRANAWRYRDYVIRAFNADKPYDRFLLEQIAGDELANYRDANAISQEVYDNLVATGFLRMAPDGTWANITNFVPDRLDVISDEMEILSSTVMGLTFKCAKCHSHKFDPITHRDYYSLLAIFKGAFDEHNWLKPLRTTRFSSGPFGARWLPAVTTEERRAWDANEKRIQDKIESLNSELKKQKTELNDADFKKLEEQTKSKIKSIESQRKPKPMIRALWDRGEPTPTYLLRRGNYLTPGEVVEPGVPAFLAGASEFEIKPPHEKSTGRRLALAKWLVRPDHPLTARVMVNRIWKHHFGRGIVRTLDNFGKTGAPPTHSQLLDWLAVEFVERGWSVKTLHRLLMTSSTYRQSSEVTAAHETLDPENRLLSRMPLRRLDAESLRDSLLFIAGRLDARQFGPGDSVKMRDDGLVTSVESPAGWRRSIFVLQRRTQPPTILDNFDLPQMGPNCIERSQSTVAPQALHLMNNKMIHRLSVEFAKRSSADSRTNREEQIEWAYLTALSRRPDTDEFRVAAAAMDRLQAAWEKKLKTASDGGADAILDEAASKALTNFCHALMNSATLLYVD